MENAPYDALVSATRATLERVAQEFPTAVLASSLAAEDMVLTDLILRAGLPIGIFTLETGRLHAETLAVLTRIKETYNYDVALFRPQTDAVEQYVAQNGLNAFYDSVEMRKECCRIRKVEPLQRALSGKKAWYRATPQSVEHQGDARCAGIRRSAWPCQVQPAGGLVGIRCMALYSDQQRAVQFIT